jgi:hypothetical protein
MPEAARPGLGHVTDEPGTMLITMLGQSGSGKTTYIVGMYAQLVHGFRGCFLHTPDQDAGVEMVDQLTKLRAGELPELTLEKPIPHDYVLRSAEGQFALDLTDYRGGAPFGLARGNDTGDTAQLRRRLGDSHSIFVALDSTHFLKPLHPGRLQAVRQATGADLFADLISKAVADRQRQGCLPPSVAVLLTKADLLDGRPGSVGRDWDELEAEVRQVLGAAFQPDVDATIIPVSVGGFGAPLDGQSPAVTLNLNALADPLIFAAGGFLKVRQAAVQRQYQHALGISQAAGKDLAELYTGGPILRWIRRKKIAAAEEDVARTLATVNELGHRSHDLGLRADAMLSRLDPQGDGQ